MILKKVFTFLRFVLVFIVVFYIGISSFPFFPPVTLLYLFYKPFKVRNYIRLLSYLQYLYVCFIILVLERLLRIQVRVTGDKVPREATLCLSNHLNHDYIPMYMLGVRCQNAGSIRTVVKASIWYVPFFGWCISLVGWPMISRNNYEKDKAVMARLFKSYKDAGLPVVLWLYPEGTRLTQDRLRQSQEYEASKGYAVWKNVMLPKHRGFHFTLESLSGIIDNVCEVTMKYGGWENDIPTIIDILSTDPSKAHVIHLNLNHVPVSDIPKGEEGRKSWLQKSFAKKEELIEYYNKNGQFNGENLVPSYYNLVELISNTLIWNSISFIVLVLDILVFRLFLRFFF